MPYVKIGNIRDPHMARMVQAAGRLRKVSQKRRGPVWDPEREALAEDETGLTMVHDLDPGVKSDFHKISESLKNTRGWMFALGGLLLGLLIAGIAWWMTTQNRSLTG